jgi:hypothetical protein
MSSLEVHRAVVGGDTPVLSAGHHCPLDDGVYLGSYRDIGDPFQPRCRV